MRFRLCVQRALPLLVLPWLSAGWVETARADDLLQRAATLTGQGRAVEAFELLDAQESARAGDPAFDEAMGAVAHAAGQYTRAVMARERLVLAQPGSVAAQVALGQSLYAVGDRTGVRGLSPEAQALLIPVGTGHQLDPFAASGDRPAKDGPALLKGHVELGVGHDSNANAGPVTGGVPAAVPGVLTWGLRPEAMAKPGSFVLAQAGLSGRAVVDARWSVVGAAAVAARQYGSDARLWSHTALDASLGLAWRAEHNELVASAQGAYYALDGSRLRTMGGALGEWIYHIDGYRQWASFVQVLDVRYPAQSLRDARRTVVGTSYAHQFRGGTSTYAGVYAGQEKPRARGAEALGHHLLGIRAGAHWPVAPRWAVFANVDWEHRRYGAQDPFFAVTRDDRQTQATLGLSWAPANGWRVTPQWTITRNTSTLPITTYDRRVFSVTVRKEF